MDVARKSCAVLAAASLLLPASLRAADTVPPSSEVVLERVIALAQAHGLNAKRVDWPTVRRAAKEQLEKDPSEETLTSSIRLVLRSLNDGHSFYRPPQAPFRPGAPPARTPPPIAVAGFSPAGTPLLTINQWAGPTGAERDALLGARRALNDTLSEETCGLIVDLTPNRGGNMWPMVGGLLPILSQGLLESFIDRGGEGTRIGSSGSSILINGRPHFLTAGPLPQPSHVPHFVAVLIGPRTASSGELTAIAFKGQENVRFFGRPTAGASTANKSSALPNGGMVAITSARMLDRSGVAYPGPVQPDVHSDDPTAAADAWLNEQCQSKGHRTLDDRDEG